MLNKREANMSVISKEDLKTLSGRREKAAVSIFIPTHQAGADTRENRIRFKNATREAERLLANRGTDPKAAQALLEPATRLVEDNNFWQHQRAGLAMFLAEGETYRYRTPRAFDELVTVSDRFHLKPLLPLLTDDGRFYVLAANLGNTRLFEASRDNIGEMDLEETPTSLDEALKYDDPEESLQQHTVSTTSGAPGRADAAFHGTGAEADDRKMKILRFFRKLDNGVREALGNAVSQGVPLVFMGVDYLFPLYKEANHYTHLLGEAVSHDPDRLSPDEVRERAWETVQPHFHKKQEKARGRLEEALAKDLGSSDLQELLPASTDARIETLFVAVGAQRWGRYDEEARQAEFHGEEEKGDEDLLDFVAVQTLLNGGVVYAVAPGDVPGESMAAAIFRF